MKETFDREYREACLDSCKKTRDTLKKASKNASNRNKKELCNDIAQVYNSRIKELEKDGKNL